MPETPATLAIFVILANNFSTQSIPSGDALRLARILASAAKDAEPQPQPVSFDKPVTAVEDFKWQQQKALDNRKVREALRDDKPILAIKEVRALLNLGLRESKEVVDAIRPIWAADRMPCNFSECCPVTITR